MKSTSIIENTKVEIHGKPFQLICLPALVIALCIMGLVPIVYENTMNMFELTNAVYEKYYFVILITYLIVLPAFLPSVLKMFKDNGITATGIITSKKSLFGDIFYGILAGICSYLFLFLDLHVLLKMPVEKSDNIIIVFLEIVSLVIVSGFFKELYFRGIPFFVMKRKYGEWKSFLFGNIFFTILDWPNYGLSFFLGTIWYLFFRKRGSLLVPMIGHGLFNLLGILARTGALSFVGIIPVTW